MWGKRCGPQRSFKATQGDCQDPISQHQYLSWLQITYHIYVQFASCQLHSLERAQLSLSSPEPAAIMFLYKIQAEKNSLASEARKVLFPLPLSLSFSSTGTSINKWNLKKQKGSLFCFFPIFYPKVPGWVTNNQTSSMHSTIRNISIYEINANI